MISYNTATALRACLQTLTAGGSALEVLVVDNDSSDDSPGLVEREFGQVRLIRAGRNLGFGTAANLGSRATSRELVLFLNPDCSVEPGSIVRLAQVFDEPTLPGFAGPKIVLESGRVDHAALRADPDPLGAALYLSRLTRLFPNSPRVNRYSLRHLDYDREQELAAGTAACLMVRRSAFWEIGGFDESFFMYGEDLDLCRRLREAGHGGRYVPSATALHVKGEASRENSTAMLREFHRAMWTYYRKHEAAKRPRPVNWAVAAGISLLAAARLGRNALRREKRVSAR